MRSEIEREAAALLTVVRDEDRVEGEEPLLSSVLVHVLRVRHAGGPATNTTKLTAKLLEKLQG